MDTTTLLSQFQGPGLTFNLGQVVLATLLSFGLALLVAWTYQATYKGVAYTQSYVYTLIMLSMVVTMIMLVVGSNLARAFTLIGALSIVRFRNAIKDTQDIGFIFLTMGVGMACGVGLYGLAVVTCTLICAIWWVMSRLNLFTRQFKEQLLRIRLPGEADGGQVLNQVFTRYLARFDLMAVESIQSGLLTELVYTVQLKPRASAQDFIAELRRLNDNNRVALVTGYHQVDL